MFSPTYQDHYGVAVFRRYYVYLALAQNLGALVPGALLDAVHGFHDQPRSLRFWTQAGEINPDLKVTLKMTARKFSEVGEVGLEKPI